MIRDLGDTVGSAVFGTLGRVMSHTQEKRPLAVDTLENDDAYLVIFDAPGAEETDVTVRFEDNTIFVGIDRHREFHEGFELVFPGRGLALDGHAELPDDAAVDPDDAEATLKEDGTLHVRIPKAEENSDDSGERADSAEENVGADDPEADDGN